MAGNLHGLIFMDQLDSGVATGWTGGVDMSTPVFPEFDFLISRNPLKQLFWGGGLIFIHSQHLFPSLTHSFIHFIHSLPHLFEVVKIIATLPVTVVSCERAHIKVKIINSACLNVGPTLGKSH